MIFKSHSAFVGQHAFLSASKYHWVNYDADKLAEAFINAQAAQRGTELHALAHQCVKLGVKLPKTSKTLNMYVNDAIGYRMETEQVLLYSVNCYGTADAICFNGRLLRVHDLKTGLNPGSVHQPRIYAALFCLEYGIKPTEIEMELRIYQNDEVLVDENPMDAVTHIMSKIIAFDAQIEQMKDRGVA